MGKHEQLTEMFQKKLSSLKKLSGQKCHFAILAFAMVFCHLTAICDPIRVRVGQAQVMTWQTKGTTELTLD